VNTEDNGVAQARRILAGLELFAGVKDSELAVTRMGGLTNLVFRIEHGPQHYVLRVPGRGTEEYINRRHEAHAAREAARVQVSPEVLHFDAQTGVMVARLVEAAVVEFIARSKLELPISAQAISAWSFFMVKRTTIRLKS